MFVFYSSFIFIWTITKYIPFVWAPSDCSFVVYSRGLWLPNIYPIQLIIKLRTKLVQSAHFRYPNEILGPQLPPQHTTVMWLPPCASLPRKSYRRGKGCPDPEKLIVSSNICLRVVRTTHIAGRPIILPRLVPPFMAFVWIRSSSSSETVAGQSPDEGVTQSEPQTTRTVFFGFRSLFTQLPTLP